MVGSISAQIALLAFAAAIVAGLYAGNAPTTVLMRAIVAMFAAMTVGKLAAWSAKLVLRDHLQKKKRAIDRAHHDAMRAVEAAEQAAEAAEGAETTVETG